VKKPVLIFSSLAVLGAGAFYMSNQVSMAKKICVKGYDYHIKKLTAKETLIEVNIDVKNKTDFIVGLNGYKLNIYAQGNHLAVIHSKQKITIESKSYTRLTLEVNLDPKQVLKGGWQALLSAKGWEDIDIHIQGSLNVVKWSIPFKLPVDLSFKLRELTSEDSSENPC
jgi:LEA14-like dessication related protein